MRLTGDTVKENRICTLIVNLVSMLPLHYNGRPVLSAITVDDRNYFLPTRIKMDSEEAEYYYSGSSGAGTQMTDFTGYNVAKK